MPLTEISPAVNLPFMKTYTLSTVMAELDRRVAKAGTVTKFAAEVGVSVPYAHRTYYRDQPIGPKILRALGFQAAETLYVKVSK